MKLKNFLKIDIASPKSILNWTERNLPNDKIIGKVNKALGIMKKRNKKLNSIKNLVF